MRRPLANLIAATAVFFAATTAAFARDAVLEGKQNWLFAGWESLTTAKPAAVKSSIGLIAGASRLFAKKNIKLIVLIVPLKPRYYEPLLPDGVAMSDEIRKRYDVLLTELRSSGVTAIDVRDAFKTVIAGKQEVFYRADFHWTTFAAEASADQVAALILSSGPLPGKTGTGMKLGDWINDRHLGDLAANFLSPERKRAIGPEAYVIRQAQEPSLTRPRLTRSRLTPDCWTAIRRRWPWSEIALCSPISDFLSGCRTRSTGPFRSSGIPGMLALGLPYCSTLNRRNSRTTHPNSWSGNLMRPSFKMDLTLSGNGPPQALSALPNGTHVSRSPCATRKMVNARSVVALPDTTQQKHHSLQKSEKNE